MKPSEILSGEHRVIEQVLLCLDKLVQQGSEQGTLPKQPALDAIDFFRNFADRCHHGKEEAHFFPAMEANGFLRDGGPTGVMLHEHELGRRHVAGMAEAIDSASAGDAAALETFATHARCYAALLREHIQKEDHCLFTMADQAFTDEDQRRLLNAFQRVESEEMGQHVHERYLKIANDLAERYGVPRDAALDEHGHRCGSCGHD